MAADPIGFAPDQQRPGPVPRRSSALTRIKGGPASSCYRVTPAPEAY
jgi:hypothetical protein